MAFYQAMPWHSGEDKIRTTVRVPLGDNPTYPMLSQNAAYRVAASPLIALGTIDDQDNVWCTLWGGDVPIAQQIAKGGILGIKVPVDAAFDPVVQILYGGKCDGEILRSDGKQGKMVSGVSVHLEDRDRVKLFGRMVAGCLEAGVGAVNTVARVGDALEASNEGRPGRIGTAQLVLQITQSLGNCPKYINKRTIRSEPGSRPRLVSDKPHLSADAISHIHSCDVFFVASRGPDDMDCNHRGGSQGFLRVEPQSSGSSVPSVLVWPEYSGNNLYQTLGNITYHPHIGLCVPNLITGDVLYLSGSAEILLDRAATSVMSKTKMAVRFTVSASRFVKQGLMFRGTPCADNKDASSSNPVVSREITDGMSPYNPRVRYLTSELNPSDPTLKLGETLPPDEFRDRGKQPGPSLTATLTRKAKLTPTITRYRFRLSSSDSHAFDPNMSPLWKPGQYVALDFSEELYMGYSHMRDDDPTSLNDDFVRTFTVASKYTGGTTTASQTPEFEIVVRNVGAVTNWLSQQDARTGWTQVAVLGFGGDFVFDSMIPSSCSERKQNVFIAAGVGITPLLGQFPARTPDQKHQHRQHQQDENTPPAEPSSPSPSSSSLTLLWTLHIRDIGLAAAVLPCIPHTLRSRTHVFITGVPNHTPADDADPPALTDLRRHNADVHFALRRMTRADLEDVETSIGVAAGAGARIANWYVCTAPAMRREIQHWLGGRSIVFENFDY